MASLLSRLKRSTKADSSRDAEGSGAVVPIREDDFGRRVELLNSLEGTGVGTFWASDAEGRLIYVSPTALEVLGLSIDALSKRTVQDFFLADRDAELEGMSDSSERPLRFRLAARNSIQPTSVQLGIEDREIWWEIAAKPLFDSAGEFLGYRGTAKDVSATHEERRDRERRSQYDVLTGLSNRYRMARQLDASLQAFKISKRSCALMMMDLDRFKQVNDTLGHPAGDELLKQVAARVKRIVGDRGEIGRLGGDEFQIILPDVDDRGELGDLGQRLIQMISQPYSIEGSRAIIGSSVGIAIAPYDGVEADELTKAADLALYAAKGGGRGQHRFYSTDLKDSVNHRAQIEEDLRDAIVKGELFMHYQPIVSAKTHEIACMEALMRWEHSERGMIAPSDFIPVAEEVGLIREIGAWALQQVCKSVVTWPGDITAAVNVSAVQFAADDFVEIVQRAIKSSGVNPARIELEITESVFVGDVERTLRMFRELKKLGVRLSLDDFGTGYSSLSYLRDAPFDKIKIDQSFVRGCSAKESNNLAIVAAVVSLANALGMQTVAEGVETKDELALVTKQGATHLQGLIFSRAVDADMIMERVAKGDLRLVPRGPERYREERRSQFKKISLIHGDHRYNARLRNISKTGAKIEGLIGVPVGEQIVLDLGGGQLAVATVRRSEGSSQGVEFETPLISDGKDGLVTRHRVSPYLIEQAGKPLQALGNDPYAALMQHSAVPRAFTEVQLS